MALTEQAATTQSAARLQRLRYLVDNEWRESKTGTYMPVMNPSTGEQIAEAPCCTQEEVDSAVAAAARAYPAWRDTPVPQRIQLMFRFKLLLDEHLDELSVLLATEMGKVLSEARGDVLKAIEVVECACSTHYLMQGDTTMNISRGYDTVSYREPLGVFVGIAPYNFPAMIPMGWMLPFAITTGNTFVLKAASMVPQTSMRMMELLIEAGLLDVTGSDVIGVAVESGCRYHASAAYPDVIHAGVRVARVGGSSIRYEVGLFRNDEDAAAAEGFFVHVMVARETMRPVAVPEALRAYVEGMEV